MAVLDDSDPSVMRVSRNIAYFNMMRSSDINAYDVIKSKKIFATKKAIKNLLGRLKHP